MHLSTATLLLLPLIPTALGARLTITIPPTTALPNPSSLPYSTRAVLSSHGAPLSVPLSRANTFHFPTVPPGQHLLSVYARDVFFETLRVDVTANATGEHVAAWTTWRGNEWDNRGGVRGEGEGRGARVEVRALAAKEFYQERTTFSVVSIFKNPMILIAIFTLGMVVGMPYLMENLDPETKAEFEEMQKKSSATANPAASIQNMDLGNSFASWMAGKPSSSSAPDESQKQVRGKK